MTRDSILYDLHNVSSSDLLALSKVRTDKDKEEYEKKGYFVPYTYDTWKEKFPKINADFIFLLSGLNFDIIYYDAQNLTYLHLSMLAMANDEATAKRMEKQIAGAILECKKMANSSNPNYVKLLSSYSDGLCIDGLARIFEKEGPSERFYKTFIAMYTSLDFLVKRLPKNIIEALPKAKSAAQKEETEKRLNQYFGNAESITVYRGMTERSTPVEDALSWTPNINIAYKFACAYGNKAFVVKAVVDRKNIIEYISPDTSLGREEETIIIPGSASIQEEIKLIPVDSDESLNALNDIMAIYQTYRAKLGKLYAKRKNQLSDHDATHSLRVLFLALFLANHEKMTKAEMKQIAEAAIYHDIGRTSETANEQHGIASAIIYQKAGGSDKAVSFMIQNHCIDDSVAKKNIEAEFSAKSKNKVWRLLSIIKDADALDRVRFGIAESPESDGLDIRYLRNDYSKKMVHIAVKAERFLEL